MEFDEDLEDHLVDMLIEHGPMTSHEAHEVMEVPAWSYMQTVFCLRNSDKFAEDDSERYHLTNKGRT